MEPIVIIYAVLGVATLLVLILAVVKIAALSKTIDRLSDQIPGTGMTAKELADELGGSIEQAFKQYVPQPEQLAGTLKEAVEGANRQQVQELERILKAFSESLTTMSEPIEASRKALTEAANGLTSGVDASTEKLQSVFNGHAAEVQNALQGVGGEWREQLAGTLADHAQKITEANNALGVQLEKIAGLQGDIEKVLHVQETVEGHIKGVAASEEFKSTLETLRSHLEESDKLLREAAKPRTIRLVESDGELAQG